MTKIKILDAMPGSGKTTKIIDWVKNAPLDQKFIFITPLLSECHRVAGTEYDEDDPYKRPIILDSEDRSVLYSYKEDAPLSFKLFKHPYFSKNGGKAESLPYLLKNNDNIVSTHQLFVNLTPDILRDAKDYILIIDEVLSVYEIYSEYSENEVQAMLRNNWISVGPDGVTLMFHRENYAKSVETEDGEDVIKDTYYETFATLCDLKQLMYVDGKLIVWELSADTLKSFKEIWIATYLFENSLMSAYLKSHDLPYETEKFGKKPSEIKDLINIYESSRKGNLNEIGDKDSSLSSSDFTRNGKKLREVLGSNLDTYFRNQAKAKKNDRLWSVFSRHVSLGGKPYKDNWLAFNTKATNDYSHIHNVAYLLNLYPNPMLVKASAQKGFSSSQDLFALSELVQFLFRSAIRNGEPINLYIPSSRMRRLLKEWLEDEWT